MIFKNVLFSCVILIFTLGKNVKSLEYEEVNRGLIAQLGNYPYHVFVKTKSKYGVHTCNGVIVDKTHVVTAAHCVTDKKGVPFCSATIKVEAGTVSLTEEPLYKGYVDGIYLTPEFTRDDDLVYADIAVLKLKKKITFNNNIGYVELADSTNTYEGEIAIFTGFGYTCVDCEKVNGEIKFNTFNDYQLRYGVTDILEKSDCLQIVNLNTTKDFDFHDQLCAQMIQNHVSEPQGTCHGDSGGPLVVHDPINQKKILVGILKRPTVFFDEMMGSSIYTRVSTYVDFIKSAQADDINDSSILYTSMNSKIACAVQ